MYGGTFFAAVTYAIKPDYQPEPECKTCNDTRFVVRTFTGSCGLETPWRPKGMCGREDETKKCPTCSVDLEIVKLAALLKNKYKIVVDVIQ